MDGPTRRAWSSPELIVLVRSGPEEAVLDLCKSQTVGGPNVGYDEVCETAGGVYAEECYSPTTS